MPLLFVSTCLTLCVRTVCSESQEIEVGSNNWENSSEFTLKKNNFINGLVPNEVGCNTAFEGAVTVVSEEVDGDFGVVTVRVPYLDVYGNPKEGLARLVAHQRDVESGKLIPPFCHVHYEKDISGAKVWAEQGWVVTTAVYNNEYPIDPAIANGNNLARAIIQWVRRLPFIDRIHLHIDGGSQGGYMALAMSAAFFPVASTTADAPVVNWAYNFNYFEANKTISGYPDKLKDSPLPILARVMVLADWSYQYFGNDLSADAWYYVSPISYLNRITNPVIITAATGDMLVPMEQMTSEGIYAYDSTCFPKGYQRDFDTLTINRKSRKTLEELIPFEKRHIYRAPLQKDTFEFTLEFFEHPEKMPKKRPEVLDRPWSKDHQWSLFYLDEGPPAPYAPHTSFFWVTLPNSFIKYYQGTVPSSDILNDAKLERLMQRYSLHLTDMPLLKEGKPINRLNFALLEKRDVLQGLLDYAKISNRHQAQLMKTYAKINLKPFGDVLNLEKIQDELIRLKKETQ